MSLHSRNTSKTGVRADKREGDYSGSFKAYTFRYETDRGDDEDVLSDEDEFSQPRYLEKELALKKVNEELEKKSSELFKKIERYRSGAHQDVSTLDGQGDHPLSYDSGTDMRFLSCESVSKPQSYHFHASEPPSPVPSYLNIISRSSSSDILEGGNTGTSYQSSGNSKCGNNRRPVTAAVVSFPHYAVSQTEATLLRRAETASPLEGVEEKHQIRLQKATESVLKCVQSKLVNYENRLSDMHLQYRQKIQENTMLEAKVKALDDDRKRLLKNLQCLQSTTDKFSKSAENCKMNLNLKVQAFASLKKEMDSLKRDLKQKNGTIQSLQTRLDRCTEENRRLKSQHQSTQLNMKQQHNEDRSAMEDLKQRVVQLEQQKVSFQSTLEKQAQLIKTLRGQKVSLTNIIKSNKIKVDNWSDLICTDGHESTV